MGALAGPGQPTFSLHLQYQNIGWGIAKWSFIFRAKRLNTLELGEGLGTAGLDMRFSPVFRESFFAGVVSVS